jgi:hypothetical protein
MFEELAVSDCRFVIGDAEQPGDRPGSAALFCAAPAIDGRPYCAKHCRIEYEPRRKRNEADQRLAKAALVAAAKNSAEKV